MGGPVLHHRLRPRAAAGQGGSIITEFKQLRQVLKEEESFLLSRVLWLGQEEEKGKKFYIASAEAQLNSFRKLIDSVKAMQRLPPSQLLRVRIPWGLSCKKAAAHP